MDVLNLVRDGVVSSPRGMETREIMNTSMQIIVPKFESITTFDTVRNKVIETYMKKELILYKDGTLDAERWRDEASRFWWELRNPDGTINSNYGFLTMIEKDVPTQWAPHFENYYRTQWAWAKSKLEQDENTRQAIMHFNKPRHMWEGNKDFPCTMHGAFHIRQGVLHYSTVMRSQDVVLGFPYDVPYFIWQQFEMAKQLGIGVGHFNHYVHSLHVYSKHYKLLERMAGYDHC